jgi:DNA-binding NarL/FixJ family response regulator
MSLLAVAIANLLRPDVDGLLLFLAIPVAIISRRGGLWPAIAAAIVALALARAGDRIWGFDAGATDYLAMATVFLMVAVLAAGPRKTTGLKRGIAGLGSRPARGEPLSPEDLLTERELEVLRMMAAGATNSQIADDLFISESTVKSHVKNVLRKLGVKNRTEAASRYIHSTDSSR